MSEHEHDRAGHGGPEFTAAVVTVSDGVSEGVREDRSGPAVAALLRRAGFSVSRREVVADDRDSIGALLRELCDSDISLVLTTGGTGFGPRDVTPEATRDVVERDAPGLAERMRAAGAASTPLAALSRAVAGSRGSTLVVNLPGSERGAVESLRAILGPLPHALRLLAGDRVHGAADAAPDPAPVAPAPDAGPRLVATAVKIHGTPPCRLGQRIILTEHGALEGTLGCAEFDDAAAADAPEILGSGEPAVRTYEHDLGAIDVFFEPPPARPALVILSATPVGTTVARWARDLGFDVTVVEPREDRARGAAGARTATSIEGVSLDANTSVVSTDHDAPGLAETLAVVLRSPARFVGVMGSRRHVGPHVERLREMGFGDEDLARVRTPTGLDLGGLSAEEIALSILAAVVADRHGAGGGWLDR